jgi:hypothetical protein
MELDVMEEANVNTEEIENDGNHDEMEVLDISDDDEDDECSENSSADDFDLEGSDIDTDSDMSEEDVDENQEEAIQEEANENIDDVPVFVNAAAIATSEQRAALFLSAMPSFCCQFFQMRIL